MTDSLNASLARLQDHAEAGDCAALLEAAREIITDQAAELESYRGGSAPDDLDAEMQLADALRTLKGCADYIEARGDNPACLREARAILEDARGEAGCR